MLVWLMVAGCVESGGECPQPPGQRQPIERSSATCADVHWGCSSDAQECLAGRGTNEMFWFIKHKGREIGCDWNYDLDGPDCDAAWDDVEAWCAAYPECQF